MVTGPPGVAKSTFVLLYLAQLQQAGYKCLYVSSEMNRIDMERYFNRFPELRELDILYLQGFEKRPFGSRFSLFSSIGSILPADGE